MAKLIKCKSCGNMVSKDASTCPQCGGKVKKSRGCFLFVILVVLFITCLSMISGGSSGSSSERKDADPFQVEVFSESGAILFVQNFLEKKLNTIVSIKLKFTSQAKITKFSDAAPEFAKHVQNNKKKIGTSINVENVWIVEQKFCDTDNREEEASYYALVEFKKGAGYRVIFMSVNNKQIFP